MSGSNQAGSRSFVARNRSIASQLWSMPSRRREHRWGGSSPRTRSAPWCWIAERMTVASRSAAVTSGMPATPAKRSGATRIVSARRSRPIDLVPRGRAQAYEGAFDRGVWLLPVDIGQGRDRLERLPFGGKLVGTGNEVGVGQRHPSSLPATLTSRKLACSAAANNLGRSRTRVAFMTGRAGADWDSACR